MMQQMVPDAVCIHLLSHFQIVCGPVGLPASVWRLRKAHHLVKILALAPEQSLAREVLLEALWPTSPRDAAGNSLRVTLSRARSALTTSGLGHALQLVWEGDRLVLQSQGSLWIDVVAFEQAAAEAQQAGSLSAYRTALGLYPGDLLPEDLYEDWTTSRRESLRAILLGLLRDYAGLLTRVGDMATAITALQRLVQLEPTEEHAHRGLMRLYCLNGQRARALRHYQQVVAILRHELATTPDPATVQLAAQIEADETSGSAVSYATATPTITVSDSAVVSVRPLTTTVMHPAGNLPTPTASFVGRARELAELETLLLQTRLLTLTGIGGIGKSRLALAVATAVQRHFAGGVWYLQISEDLDAPTIEAAMTRLASQDGPGDIDAAVEPSAGDPSHSRLLLLDDCDLLHPSCTASLKQLLLANPALRVMATCRWRLGIDGEQVWSVPPLTLPAPLEGSSAALLASDAVHLFCDRARAVRPQLAVNDDLLVQIATICQQLDGLPLAIELAAARLSLLSIPQLLERLTDRFRLLTTNFRATDLRHRTLYTVVDWSYGLLDGDDRRLLAHLAVFTGGFRLEAAEWVVGPAVEQVLDGLDRLVEHSLVVAECCPDGEIRFRLLETVRLYASNRLAELGQLAVAQERHAAYFLRIATQTARLLNSAAMEPALVERLREESENLRTAFSWVINQGDQRPAQYAIDETLTHLVTPALE